MKSVNEEPVEVTTIKPQEGHPGLAGEVSSFVNRSEEIPPAPHPSAPQEGTAAPQSTPTEEPAITTQTTLKKPVLLLENQHPANPATPDMTPPPLQVDGELQTCLPTNDSLGSNSTSVLSPSSLSDSHLLEAVLDDTSILVPEEPAEIGVNSHTKKTDSSNTEINEKQSSNISTTGDGTNEASPNKSHVQDSMGLETSQGKGCIIARTCSQEEAISSKQLDPNVSVVTLGEGIVGCDVPDGLEPEDLPSVSEVEPPSLKPEPKKQLKLFKRNKKKSNQGNLSIHLNKAQVWNASLYMCLKILICFTSIVCMGYFSLYS